MRGIFGDPKACIVDLVRRSKKRPVVAAVAFTVDGTTGVRAEFAICPAAIGACICSSRCGVFGARVAAR